MQLSAIISHHGPVWMIKCEANGTITVKGYIASIVGVVFVIYKIAYAVVLASRCYVWNITINTFQSINITP